MGEYRKGSLNYGQHSSEAAWAKLVSDLKKSKEHEQRQKEKAAAKQVEEDKLYDTLDQISKEGEMKHAELRAKQRAQDKADEQTEARRQKFVASPAGQAEAEAARKRIEFFGHPPEDPKSRAQVAREKTMRDYFPRLAKLLNPN